MSYEDNYIIPIDVAGNGSCFRRSIIKSHMISCETTKVYDCYATRESHSDITIGDFVENMMGKDVHWVETFQMTSVSIVYHFQIISIANFRTGFGLMDTYHDIETFNYGFQFKNVSKLKICVYCRIYKVPITSSSKDIYLDYFAYL